MLASMLRVSRRLYNTEAKLHRVMDRSRVDYSGGYLIVCIYINYRYMYVYEYTRDRGIPLSVEQRVNKQHKKTWSNPESSSWSNQQSRAVSSYDRLCPTVRFIPVLILKYFCLHIYEKL